jgi:hypothetical protein
LASLQSLAIYADRKGRLQLPRPHEGDAALQLAAQQFPGGLTSLTHLVLPLGIMCDISSVSACVGLRDLVIFCPGSEWEWDPQEWDALAQLTRLTRLHVGVDLADSIAVDESFGGVLLQLTELFEVGTKIWTRSLLPLLQSLAQVSAVYGHWDMDNGVDLTAFTCPHIRKLGDALDPPLQVFPNLVCASFISVRQREMLDLSRYCTSLQELLCPSFSGAGVGVHSAGQCSAFRSLAHLQHLTHLELALPGDAALVAFTSAVAAVSIPRLRCLHVRGELIVPGLMQLQSVRGLTELVVYVGEMDHVEDSFSSRKLVSMWLVGLAVVPKVSMVVRSAEQ